MNKSKKMKRKIFRRFMHGFQGRLVLLAFVLLAFAPIVVAEDKGQGAPVKPWAEVCKELQDKGLIPKVPEEVKQAQKVIRDYWEANVFRGHKVVSTEPNEKGKTMHLEDSPKNMTVADIRTTKYIEETFWFFWGDFLAFNWMMAPKEDIGRYLGAGKELLEAYLKTTDKEALEFDIPEMQTVYRVQSLQYAIDVFSWLREESLYYQGLLVNDQAKTRAQLRAMHANNFLTTLRNLQKAIR